MLSNSVQLLKTKKILALGKNNVRNICRMNGWPIIIASDA
jgi:hypothetical protein